jgi:hypothetical protein
MLKGDRKGIFGKVSEESIPCGAMLKQWKMEDAKVKRGFLPLPRNAIAPGLCVPKTSF